MKGTMFVGLAAAGLMAGTSVALANDDQAKSSQTSSTQMDQSKSSPTQTDQSKSSATQMDHSTSSTSSATTGTSQTGTSTGTSASASNESKLSGKIASIDKDKKMVTIASDSGSQQELKVGSSTNITKDGSSCGLTQLQSGDEVRASFDPTSKQATTLEVKTKDKDKDQDKAKKY